MSKSVDLKKNFFLNAGKSAQCGGNTNIVNNGTINIFQGGSSAGQSLRQTGKAGLGNSKNASDLSGMLCGNRNETVNHTNFKNTNSIFGNNNHDYNGRGYYGHDEHGGIGQEGVHDRNHCQMMNTAQENEDSFYKTTSSLQKSTNNPDTIGYATPLSTSCSNGSSCSDSSSNSGDKWAKVLSGLTALTGMAFAGFGVYKMFSGNDSKSTDSKAAEQTKTEAERKAVSFGTYSEASKDSKTANSSSSSSSNVGDTDSVISKSKDSVKAYEQAKTSGNAEGTKATQQGVVDSAQALASKQIQITNAQDSTAKELAQTQQEVSTGETAVSNLDAMVQNSETYVNTEGTEAEKADAVKKDADINLADKTATRDRLVNEKASLVSEKKEKDGALTTAKEGKASKNKAWGVAAKNKTAAEGAYNKEQAATVKAKGLWDTAKETTATKKIQWTKAQTNLSDLKQQQASAPNESKAAYDEMILQAEGEFKSANDAYEQAKLDEKKAEDDYNAQTGKEAEALDAKEAADSAEGIAKSEYETAVEMVTKVQKTVDEAQITIDAKAKELESAEQEVKTAELRTKQSAGDVIKTKEGLEAAKQRRDAVKEDLAAKKDKLDALKNQQTKLNADNTNLRIQDGNIATTLQEVKDAQKKETKDEKKQ